MNVQRGRRRGAGVAGGAGAGDEDAYAVLEDVIRRRRYRHADARMRSQVFIEVEGTKCRGVERGEMQT